jgi:hypothetical protein
LSHNRRVTQQTTKRAQREAEQAAVLEELKVLAERLGYEVRAERLLREVGYRVRSGTCRLRELRIILLDRDLPLTAQIDVLVEELAAHRLDDVYVSPALRRRLERATPGAAVTPAGDELAVP